jgi:hypothetical protein
VPKGVETGCHDARRPLDWRLQASDEIPPRDTRSECSCHIGHLIADHERRAEIDSELFARPQQHSRKRFAAFAGLHVFEWDMWAEEVVQFYPSFGAYRLETLHQFVECLNRVVAPADA